MDPYSDRIEAYLKDDDGNHRATWIYDQLAKAGYTGSYETVKRSVHTVKSREQRLAYVRFETIPGEQAQVDFGEFHVLLADGTIKKYYLFAMVLGYSRRLFARLLERCDLPSFLEAHLDGFDFFGGVPREVLYDRMRNVYIRTLCQTPGPDGLWRGVGKPLFTQSLMTLAVHTGFTPVVAPAYAPWVKGKVERPMDFVRESWWRGYDFVALATANRDLAAWLVEKEKRVHGTTRERVNVRFEREKPHLQALPPQRLDVSLRLTREVRKDCTISVDGNRYILPHTLVGIKMTVRVKGNHLRIFENDRLVEEYDMPAGKGRMVGLERGYYEALRADRKMQERKFGANKSGCKEKGRARVKRTISPSASRHLVVVEPATPPALFLSVEHRSIDAYARLGGEVCYG